MRQMLPCPYCGSPNPPGQRFCGACGAMVVARCPHCQATVEPKRRFCPNCGADLFGGMQQQTASGMFTTQAGRAVKPAFVQDRSVEGISRIKINWFQRHLNWAIILGIVGSYLLAFIIAFVLGFLFYELPNDVLEGFGLTIGLLIPIPLISIIVGWVLRQKSRRLWWLLMWWLVPFGWIVVFALENRRSMQ